MASFLIKREIWSQVHIQEEEHHVKIGVMPSQAKELAEVRRDAFSRFSPSTLRGHLALLTPDL